MNKHEHLKQKMIDCDTNDNEDRLSWFEGIKMISMQSIWPIFGNLCHPSYLLVNSIILGQIDRDCYSN